MLLDGRCDGDALGDDQGDWVYSDRHGATSILHARGVAALLNDLRALHRIQGNGSIAIHDLG